MSLIKEKEELLIVSAEQGDSFPIINPREESYYVRYNDSKHYNGILCVYSSDYSIVRNDISMMWNDTHNKQYISTLCTSMYKTKENEDSILEAIDLYNYMM